jgi:hypothetical protein
MPIRGYVLRIFSYSALTLSDMLVGHVLMVDDGWTIH